MTPFKSAVAISEFCWSPLSQKFSCHHQVILIGFKVLNLLLPFLSFKCAVGYCVVQSTHHGKREKNNGDSRLAWVIKW